LSGCDFLSSAKINNFCIKYLVEKSKMTSTVTSELYRLFLSDSTAHTTTTPTSFSYVSSQSAHATTPLSKSPALVRARRAAGPLPVPVGCAVKGLTKTIVTVPVSSPDRLDTILRLVQSPIKTALANGNDVHLLFLGASAATVPRLVEMATNGVEGSDFTIAAANIHLVAVHLVELKALSRDQAFQYLQACTPAACFGGDGPDAAGALWVIGAAAGTAADADASSSSSTPVATPAWKEKTIVKWRAMLQKMEAESTAAFLNLLDSMPSPPPPVHGFLKDGSTLVRLADSAAAFSCMRRHYVCGSDHLLCGEEWAELSSTSWHVCTWCHSTATALTSAHQSTEYVDRSVKLDELQYDVNIVLSTLIKAGATDFLNLRGLLGPSVVYGRGGKEVLRVVQWSYDDDEGKSGGFLTLIPESYVRFVLSDMSAANTELYFSGPQVFTNGFMFLPHQDAVMLDLPDLSSVEQIDEAAELKNRVWRLPDTMKKVPLPALRTGTSGSVIDTVENQLVFFTVSTDSSECNLEGLTVRWAFADSKRDLATLDAVIPAC
jgi:hypothetical protein